MKRKLVTLVAIVIACGLYGVLAHTQAQGDNLVAERLPRSLQFARGGIQGYDRETSVFDRMLRASGDTMSYAEYAKHPTLPPSSVKRFGDRGYASYRATHPLWSWLLAILSFGHDAWVPALMLILSIISFAFLIWVLADWVPKPYLALFSLLLPGVMVSMFWLLPETLGLALTLVGMSTGSPVPFVGAGLIRESFLIIPAAMFLQSRDRKYLIPFAVWGVWLAVVLVRVGSFSDFTQRNGFFGWPFTGLVRVLSYWQVMEWVSFGLLIVCGVAAFRRYPLIIGGYAVLAATLGWGVWVYWIGFARPLLPVYALGMIELLRRVPLPQNSIPDRASPEISSKKTVEAETHSARLMRV